MNQTIYYVINFKGEPPEIEGATLLDDKSTQDDAQRYAEDVSAAYASENPIHELVHPNPRGAAYSVQDAKKFESKILALGLISQNVEELT